MNNKFNIIDTKLTHKLSIGNFNTIKGDVKIGENVTIGNNCTIEGDIAIGDNCIIGNNVTIVNNVTIGDNNKIFSGCSIGYMAQHYISHSIENKSIDIGNNNIFRENCTMHLPFHFEKTIVKNNCFIMVNTNIPHDAIIYNNVTIAYNVAIGGGCTIYEFANIGLNSTIHQNIKIGSYAMIGMGTEIKKDVLPFLIVHNSNKKVLKINKVGFERNYQGDIKLLDIQDFHKNLQNNKEIPENLCNEFNKILEPFRKLDSKFYC